MFVHYTYTCSYISYTCSLVLESENISHPHKLVARLVVKLGMMVVLFPEFYVQCVTKAGEEPGMRLVTMKTHFKRRIGTFL